MKGKCVIKNIRKWKLSLHPDLQLYDLEKDSVENKPINQREIKRKLRGMVIQLQREMNGT